MVRKMARAAATGGFVLLLAAAALPLRPALAAQPERVEVTGEVIDTWCYISQIMIAQGTAHHQCAVWCAAGGIPVGILAEDGTVYMVMKYSDGGENVADPAVMEVQTHEVQVAGDLYRRDGINYLFVHQVRDDNGIVNRNHEQFGIQPFGK